MTTPFTIGDETTHVVGDARCPECLEEYPEPCDPASGLAVAHRDRGSDEARDLLDRDVRSHALITDPVRHERHVDVQPQSGFTRSRARRF